MSSILKITNLEKTFFAESGNLTILKNLNMELEEGCKCVIIGKSGSGKSTLLNIIGGLDNASSGSVIFDGQEISSMNEEELTSYRQKSLGLIFQFHYLLKDFTALENVFLPAYIAGLSKKEAMEKAMQLIKDVNLENRANHLPSQLSGGERQRVAVARSLINNPKIILADEPTGNLDPQNAALISELLFDMADRYKKTLILVTHDMNIAKKGDVTYYIENASLVEAKR